VGVILKISEGISRAGGRGDHCRDSVTDGASGGKSKVEDMSWGAGTPHKTGKVDRQGGDRMRVETGAMCFLLVGRRIKKTRSRPTRKTEYRAYVGTRADLGSVRSWERVGWHKVL